MTHTSLPSYWDDHACADVGESAGAGAPAKVRAGHCGSVKVFASSLDHLGADVIAAATAGRSRRQLWRLCQIRSARHRYASSL
jgi:hypothetical protein